MNRNKLKSYAPKARREFIKAMTDRAAYYGLTKENITPVIAKGDIAIIGDRPFPKSIAEKRKKLEERITSKGFDQVMEAMAYTWFNRFVAIRFMELHGYLEHGYRVLSTADNTETVETKNSNGLPEILKHIEHVALPGLDHKKVIDLKLDGSKESELYRMVLIAQCNALHEAMPFLFEKVNDETGLLLPDNLLHSDSLIRKLVSEIPEEDWQEVEIIGWLYQFYISEKKDEVFEGLKKNKKITPENIPAATQLFTPHWIVRYLVENSLGRLWMLNRPHSRLIEKMDYYIRPETPETDFIKINSPEEIKMCDPACGSGHMLVYAFDLLYSIYEELGYKGTEIPQKILENNLYGIEIDERAGELSAFALVTKAREKDRRFFQRRNVTGKTIEPNICVLENIKFSHDEIEAYMDKVGRDLFTNAFQATLHQFDEADNFGSLIQPLLKDTTDIKDHIDKKEVAENIFLSPTHKKVLRLLRQVEYLSPKYHVVIANPPYMGLGNANNIFAVWAKDTYPNSRSDLFAMFIERNLSLSLNLGLVAMITMQSWMFLTSFEELRNKLLLENTILNLAHLGARAFDSIGGEVVATTAFILEKVNKINYQGNYFRLVEGNSEAEKEMALHEGVTNRNCGYFYCVSASDFKKIPGCPIAYWVSEKVKTIFVESDILDNLIIMRKGLATSDNTRFLRVWHEVDMNKIGLRIKSRETAIKSKKKWFPIHKGGPFRKWYGNHENLINWENDGYEIRNFFDDNGKLRSRPQNLEYSFKPALTWSKITSEQFSARYCNGGFLFDDAGAIGYSENENLLKVILPVLSSKIGNNFLKIINCTLNFQIGDVARVPLFNNLLNSENLIDRVNRCISLSTIDWDSYETSWDFIKLPLLDSLYHQDSLKDTYKVLRFKWHNMTVELQHLEIENNQFLLDAYNLLDELNPAVTLSEVTLICNPYYRYGNNKNEEELEAVLLTDTMKELISYAVGCIMGRYSLDAPGLIYANSGNEGFREIYYEKHNKPISSQSNTILSFPWSKFSPDKDGIIPITDIEWFDDDVVNRVIEFIGIAWPKETLEENLRFIADAFELKQGESSRDTIRRYMVVGFYKHHLSMYKKRPIYWLFSSGKERAFQCLVYLHRYNEGTLARIRTEYVIPLQGKINARIDQLKDDIKAASSTIFKRKLEKEQEKLVKQRVELQTFDEKLRHYADKRISLDLDDGVKVNYGKFGDLLAEVKAVTGQKND